MAFFSHVDVQTSQMLPYYPADYSAVTRGPNHKWTLEQKITLLELQRKYANSWAEKTTVFIAYFQGQFKSTSLLPEGVLRTMFYGLNKEYDEYLGDWGPIQKALEEKATSIGITLRKSSILATAAQSTSSSISLHTPSKRLRNRFATGDITPSSRPSSLQSQIRQINYPQLAFRAWSDASQGTELRAGRFVHQEVPTPPDPNSSRYLEDARRHIERKHEGPTPFISVSSSLLRVLRYGSLMKFPSSITVIDLHKAGKVKDYDLALNPFLQEVSVLNPKPDDPYTGRGEYLLYGSIEAEAIIATLSLTELTTSLSRVPGDPFGVRFFQSSSTKRMRKQIAKTHLRLDFTTGQYVANFLQVLQIPKEFTDSGVSAIIKDWKFHGYRKNWRKNEDFVKGINMGLAPHSLQPSSFIDLRPDFVGITTGVRSSDNLELVTPPKEKNAMLPSIPDDLDVIVIESSSESESEEDCVPADFVQELQEAAIFDALYESQDDPTILADIVKDLESVLDVKNSSSSRLDEASSSDSMKRLVEYSDSDEDIGDSNQIDLL